MSQMGGDAVMFAKSQMLMSVRITIITNLGLYSYKA